MKLTRKDFLKVAAATTVGSIAASSKVPSGASAQQADMTGTKGRKRTPTRGVTQEVVGFIAKSRIDQFPADVVQQGKRCLIDGFGVVLAGSTLHGSAIIRDYVKSGGGKQDASLLGPERVKVSAELAALANGASGHAMDFDDTQLSTTPDRTFGLLTHPTVPVLASALALSERLGATGQEALTYLKLGMPPPRDWREQSLAKVEEAAKPYGALEFVVISGVKQLVNAAAEVKR